MNRMGSPFAVAVFILLLIVPAVARQEERTRPASVDVQSAGRVRETTGSPQAAAPSIASRGVAATTSSSPPAFTTARDTGRNEGIFVSSSQSGRNSFVAIPDLKGSSFSSSQSYFAWERFYRHLYRDYFFFNRPVDYARFFINREPLVPPREQKWVLRQSLHISTRMVLALEELEELLNAHRSGMAVDKNEIIGKAREIRELALMIQKDYALNYMDQRAKIDILQGRDKELKRLGLDVFDELRQMIIDVNVQMKDMYGATQTHTLSWQALSQPSFESHAKGIEKLSKIIENSAKRL